MRVSPVPFQPTAPLQIPQDRPVYRIKSGKFFGPDDSQHEEGEFIVWKEEPNQEMEPMNELAQENMTKYLKKLDGFGRQVAEKMGKSYTSLADAHANSYALAQQESKQFEVLTAKKTVPLMGGKNINAAAIEKVEVSTGKSAPMLSEPKKQVTLADKNQKVTVD